MPRLSTLVPTEPALRLNTFKGKITTSLGNVAIAQLVENNANSPNIRGVVAPVTQRLLRRLINASATLQENAKLLLASRHGDG